MAYFTPTQQWYPAQLQMRNQGMGMIAPQMPSMPMAMPNVANDAPLFPMQRQPIPQPMESPIERGIASGLNAGMQNADITQAQHDRLMGLAIAKMFGGMSSKNPSILGGLNEGLASGIDTYAAQRAEMEKMNMLALERQDRLMREAQAQKEREQQRKELQNYRNEMLALRRDALDAKKGSSSEIASNIDMSNAPELDKATRSKYSVDFKGTGKLLSEINSIKKGINDLKQAENEGGKPFISQANPYLGGTVNPIKDIMGRGKGKLSEQLNKERLARESVNSKLQKFRLGAERALKGGQLTQGIYDRFEKMKTFPDLSQGYDTVENLLNDIEKEAKDIHTASDISLRTNKQITPYELESYQADQRAPMSDEPDLAEKNRQFIQNDISNIDAKIRKAKELGFTEEEINAVLQE